VKKRILVLSEAHYLKTGYATYCRNLLQKLVQAGEYELGEFANYGSRNDPRCNPQGWRFYGALPESEEEQQVYNSSMYNQFGRYKFEDVVLDFRPTHILAISDHWMWSHVIYSPLRQFYKFVAMPTCDANELNPDWLKDYENIDVLLGYTDWAGKRFEQESNGRLKFFSEAPNGVDPEYQPIQDKTALKEQIGLPRDSIVIGTIMRNQVRKLYPDLFEGFSKLLKSLPHDLANKLYFYTHLSYPDLGWNIPQLLKRWGITHKVVFTYLCRACGVVQPQFYSDAKSVCPNCKNYTLCLPNTQLGVDNQVLSYIMNSFDLYVQFANSGSLEIPLTESAHCSVPVASLDYAGPSDVVRKLSGIPIKTTGTYIEPNTNLARAVPDLDDFVAKLSKFVHKPESLRHRDGIKTKQLAEKWYSWDRCSKIWRDAIEKSDLPERNWNEPAAYINPCPHLVRQDSNNYEFVMQSLDLVAGRPELKKSYMAMKMISNLNWGATTQAPGGSHLSENSMGSNPQAQREYNRQEVVSEMISLANHHNHFESRRVAK
jgi:glycosyltransferase involved in cell wall biosynthesis